MTILFLIAICDNTNCYLYDNITENKAAFGYPSDGEALAYCQSFRMSLVAITIMCFAMHGIAAACAVCIRFNAEEGRTSLVHEVYDFDAATAFHDVASARSSFAAAPGTGATQLPMAPKPLLSRANTQTGAAPATVESPQIPQVYQKNPMAGNRE